VPVNAAPAPIALLLRNPRRHESTLLVSFVFLVRKNIAYVNFII
jgi:hypothetical protein